MTHYLSIPTDELSDKKAYWTGREITQQPGCWQQVSDDYSQLSERLEAWLDPILSLPDLRIVLTGAGTSAYIGETLAPYLTNKTGRQFEAISTTDLVSSPTEYLIPSTPTLLVSYGRSGDSPESVAATKLSDEVVQNCFHLVITCNIDGALAKFARGSKKAFNFSMPKETLDQSFAMTSSFTSMYIATLCVFSPSKQQLDLVIQSARCIIEHQSSKIETHAKRHTDKVVFLGSSSLSGIAKEASLKLLELTAGHIECYNETSLGFRHGPKSLVNQKTEVIILNSNDPYVGQYDTDIYEELVADNVASSVTCLSTSILSNTTEIEGAWLGLPYIVYCQMFAFYKSLSYGITPDNPCPTGEVNRVVQGVNIYQLKPAEAI